jgi:hypothetical protein
MQKPHKKTEMGAGIPTIIESPEPATSHDAPSYTAFSAARLTDAANLPPQYIKTLPSAILTSPTAACIARAGDSEASFDVKKHGAIVSFDTSLHDPAHVFSFLKTHLSRPPTFMIRVSASHSVHYGDDHSPFAYKTHYVYDFQIDLSKYVSAWETLHIADTADKGPIDVESFVENYTASTSSLKQLSLLKQIEWNYSGIYNAVTRIINNTNTTMNYSKPKIAFQLTRNEVEVNAPGVSSKILRSIKSSRNEAKIVAVYRMRFTEAEFFERNHAMIALSVSRGYRGATIDAK